MYSSYICLTAEMSISEMEGQRSGAEGGTWLCRLWKRQRSLPRNTKEDFTLWPVYLRRGRLSLIAPHNSMEV